MTKSFRIAYAIFGVLIPISAAAVIIGSISALWTGEWRWLIVALAGGLYLWRVGRLTT